MSSFSYSSSRRRVRESVAKSWRHLESACTENREVLESWGSCDLSEFTANSRSSEYMNYEDEQIFLEQSESTDVISDCDDGISTENITDDFFFFSDSDSDSEADHRKSFKLPLGTKVAEWAMRHNVTHNALGELLVILRDYHPGLPVDPRTLLQTPRNYAIRELDQQQGKYYHFGISAGLQSIGHTSLPVSLSLQFNFDGLPLFKSSSCELWPILCLVRGVCVEPFVVGIYCGVKKPQCLSVYLADFVSDLQYLLSNGIDIGECHFIVKIDCFVCDAPARAFIKNMKQFSGYHGCDKCTEEGSFIERRMTYPKCNEPLRTDEQFSCSADEDHHRGPTPLSALNFGLVTGFVLDYMHLVCLGVTRKLVLYWMRGPLKKDDKVARRLPAAAIEKVSAKLLQLKKFIPRDFARKPRSLSEIDRWKATELRAFLLYFGPIVLCGVLSDAVYSHFLVLSSAISLLASPRTCMQFNDYANQLLCSFVDQAKHLYGPEFIVYNVHSLVHLSADVKRYGYLDQFSAFPFENQLRSLKRLLRKGAMPLSQIVRRVSERRRFTLGHLPAMNRRSSVVHSEHSRGPVPVGFELAQQFLQLRQSGLFLSLAESDNCISVAGIGPLLIHNIIKLDNEALLVCKAFKNACDIIHYPFPSSSIGIVSVSHLSNEYIVLSANGDFLKCARLPIETNPTSPAAFAIFPLLHSQ